MSINARMIINALMTAIELMSVAGCGYNSARNGTGSQEVAIHSIDIQAMKDAAMSNLATNKYVVNAGGGHVAKLTIDGSVQRIVSEVLVRYADTNDTGVGWATVLSVKDGAVLAIADCGGDTDAPRPFALTRLFTPGHLISTLTVAAALDAGIATPDSELFTDASEAFYYQYKLPGDGGHIWESTTLTVSNALAYSSNVVLSKLGVLVGRDREYDVLNKFGIGTRTGIGFTGESAGRLLPPERCSRMQLTRIPIGQGLEITAIQIARAYATLANHGERVDPYAVKRIANASGETLYEHVVSTNKVQVVSREAADSVCSILEGAVKADDLNDFNGLNDNDPPDIAKSLVTPRVTGRRAVVDGMRIAGKTSTAQRLKANSYEYDFDRYIASFAGFFPADDPQYVLVVCYETKRVEGIPYIHHGGGRPAMAFAEIVKAMSFTHNHVPTKK